MRELLQAVRALSVFKWLKALFSPVAVALFMQAVYNEPHVEGQHCVSSHELLRVQAHSYGQTGNMQAQARSAGSHGSSLRVHCAKFQGFD
jgi:hypothetical protein